MPRFQTFTAQLVRSEFLSELTRHLEFQVRGETPFAFVAGQWLSFKHVKPGGEEITRAYSLASPPRTDNRFALCLNRVQDGYMSNYLCDMKPGDELSVQGPYGSLILRPPMRDSIFIATGTGIAPIRSMLRWLFHLEDGEPGVPAHGADSRHQDKAIWLVFGNRTEKDIYYHSEFQQIAASHPNFRYLPTLSRAGEDWSGLRGYVQQHVSPIAEGRKDMNAYICGLKKMVRANRDLLLEMGWERRQVLYETYD